MYCTNYPSFNQNTFNHNFDTIIVQCCNLMYSVYNTRAICMLEYNQVPSASVETHMDQFVKDPVIAIQTVIWILLKNVALV